MTRPYRTRKPRTPAPYTPKGPSRYERNTKGVHAPLLPHAVATPCPSSPRLKNHLRTWESVSAWADFLDSNRAAIVPQLDDTWATGGLPISDCFNKARHGDDSAVEVSDDYLAKLENVSDFVMTSHKTSLQVVGGGVCVPAALTGHPMHMRSRRRVESQQTPLTIFASITSSAGVGESALRQRGAAILALVRILSSRRPVTLWAGYCLRERDRCDDLHVGAIRIDTSPMDLTRAAHMLTHQSIARGFGIRPCVIDRTTLNNGIDNGDGLPVGLSVGDVHRNASERFIRDTFNTGGADVFIIGGAYLDDPLIKNPVAWIQKQVLAFGHGATIGA